jgi:hypothetical protein
VAAGEEGPESVNQSPTWLTRPWGAYDQLTGMDESGGAGVWWEPGMGVDGCASGEAFGGG